MIDIIIQDQNIIITPRLFEQIKIVSVIVRPLRKKFVVTKYDFHVEIGFIRATSFLICERAKQGVNQGNEFCPLVVQKRICILLS